MTLCESSADSRCGSRTVSHSPGVPPFSALRATTACRVSVYQAAYW